MLSSGVGLSGNSLIEFKSGQITTIAVGSALSLIGSHAFVADAGNTSSNSALRGLNTVVGSLNLENGAAVRTSGGLTNSGAITLDGAKGDGGSLLHINGALKNSGTLQIGPIQTGPNKGVLSAESTLDATGIVNTGTINLYGNEKAGVDASLHSHGAFTNDGSVNLSNDALTNNDKIAGPVSGTGDFSLSKHSTLNLGSSVSSGETVTFNGVDKLILGQPSSFDGVIDDFTTAGDTVVLKGFAESATSLLYAQTGADSCSLTLTDATHSAVIHFAGAAYTQSDFSLAPWFGGAGSAIKFV